LADTNFTRAPEISTSIEVSNFSGGTFTVTVEQLHRLLTRQKTIRGRVKVRLENAAAYLDSGIDPELVLRADGNFYRVNGNDRGDTKPIARLVSVSGTLTIVPPKLRTYPYEVPSTSADLDKVVNKIGGHLRDYLGIPQPAPAVGATAIGQCQFKTPEYLVDYPLYRWGDRVVSDQRDATCTFELLSDGKSRVTKLYGHRGGKDSITTDGYHSKERTINDYVFPLWPSSPDRPSAVE
jgi:hypothetical protein